MDGCGFSEKPLSISLHPMSVCSSSLASGQVSITIKQPPNPVITKPYETILKQLLFVVLKSSPDFSPFPLFLHVQFLFSLQFPSFLLNPNPFSLFHQNPKRKKTELPISFFFLKSSVLTNKASWFPLSTKMSFPSSRRTSKKPFLQLSLPGQSSPPLSVFLTTTLSLSPCFHTPSQKHSKSSQTTNPHPAVVVFLLAVFLLFPPIPSKTNLLKTTTKHSSCVFSLIPFLLSTGVLQTPSLNFSFMAISNHLLLLLIQTTESEGK